MLSTLLAPTTGCRRRADGDRQKAPPDSVQARPGRIPLTMGGARLWAEVADRPETRQSGLMFRRSLPVDEGMLFVFEQQQQLEFWMKNTYLPLEIAFVASNGTILNIEAMKPLDEGPRYRSRGPARFAIEANQGWFRQHGVKPGDKVKF